MLEAAKERISWTFDNFDRIAISFSGGKDSTVMLHLVMDEAIKRNRSVCLFFVDWECQLTLTINHIKAMYNLYANYIEPYWIALPMTTVNACSQYEPEWTAWDESKRDVWVRQKDPISISTSEYIPCHYDGITFEEFTPLFAKWYSMGHKTAFFIGIRSAESLNRYRTIARDKPMLEGNHWTTNVVDNVWNVYPIYDWEAKDNWTYHGKFKKPYNALYDLMHKAGMSLSQMRIDEPFGDTQKQGLWLYQIVEPSMWAKITSRVKGVNSGALYAKDGGNITGTRKLSLPVGHTWESFSNNLLTSMPPKTGEHYKNKISVYLKWYRDRGYPDGIPDEADLSMEMKGKIPAWRQICKALLRNDFWCMGLGFGATKSSAYKKYLLLMRRRRSEWGIYNEKTENEN